MSQVFVKVGFTLIELSIVLVIIGLIVGGVLTGRDLIAAAEVRAQIAQIEKYNAAVNAFKGKYGGLPGDLPEPSAGNFGFQPRGPYTREGDGNGVLQGNCYNSANGYGYFHQGCGEPAVFWQDLSTARLIDATILGHDVMGANYPWTTGYNSDILLSGTVPAISGWLPTAKIGKGSYVYVYGWLGDNYFAVSTVTKIGWAIESTTNPGLTVQQAYNIDRKIDDGLPQSGSVTACYVNYQVINMSAIYAAGSLLPGANNGLYDTGYGTSLCTPTTAAIAECGADFLNFNVLRFMTGTEAARATGPGNAWECVRSTGSDPVTAVHFLDAARAFYGIPAQDYHPVYRLCELIGPEQPFSTAATKERVYEVVKYAMEFINERIDQGKKPTIILMEEEMFKSGVVTRDEQGRYAIGSMDMFASRLTTRPLETQGAEQDHTALSKLLAQIREEKARQTKSWAERTTSRDDDMEREFA